MLLDLHSHSNRSPDSKVDPVRLVRHARSIGLDGVAITDHNSLDGFRRAADVARAWDDFLLIPAVEVSTIRGHVLAYGVTDPVPRNLSPEQTVERILALGGVAVAAHPYRFWSGLGEEATVAAKFAAYETHNARTLGIGNRRAAALASARSVGCVGGSDAHFLSEIGRGITAINTGGSDVDSVLQTISARRSIAQGVSRGPRGTVFYVGKCVTEWVARGLRRI